MRLQAVINEGAHSPCWPLSRPAAAPGCSLQATCGFIELQVSRSIEIRSQQKHSTSQSFKSPWEKCIAGTKKAAQKSQTHFCCSRPVKHTAPIQGENQMPLPQCTDSTWNTGSNSTGGGCPCRNSTGGSRLCMLFPLTSTACFLCCAGDMISLGA